MITTQLGLDEKERGKRMKIWGFKGRGGAPVALSLSFDYGWSLLETREAKLKGDGEIGSS